MSGFIVNEGKKESIIINGKNYARYGIQTHLITDKDDIVEVVKTYASPLLQEGDILFITEKVVGCTQGRALPIKDIKPRKLAIFLSRFVVKTPYGIGLAMPETMEMALRECGTLRILFAAAVSAITKLFGLKGWFYRVAGEKARSIDGPCDCTIPPYNEYVSLAPLKPNAVAKEISDAIGYPVAITDINDLGGVIMGTSSNKMNKKELAEILKDNPLGQSSQQTPLGVIREIKNLSCKEYSDEALG